MTLSAGANELVLFTENDSHLMTRRFPNFAENLTKKKASGKYDRTQAVKLMMYFTDEAAKKYVKDGGGEWSKVFPKADREQVAAYFRDHFEEQYKEGHYDKYIPKKYQPKAPKKK